MGAWRPDEEPDFDAIIELIECDDSEPISLPLKTTKARPKASPPPSPPTEPPGDAPGADHLYDRALAWKDLAARQAAFILGPGSNDMLDLTMATTLCAVRRPKSPVWLFTIGPPSRGKTDTARRVKTLSRVIAKEKFTASAFATGFKNKQGRRATGLLGKLDGKMLLVSETAAFFQKDEATIKALLSDMTVAYDGGLGQATGMDMDGDDVDYVAQWGFLACATAVNYDRFEHYIRSIGSRFLNYRLPVLTKAEDRLLRTQVAAAIRAKDRDAKDDELTQLVTRHMGALIAAAEQGHPMAELSEAADRQIEHMAEVLAACRGMVMDNDIEIDGASRGYQQLRTLGRALAEVRGRPEAGPDELDLLWRVMLGSMPRTRARIVRVMAGHPEGLTVAQYEEEAGLAPSTAKDDLRDLVKLGVLTSETPVSETHKKIYWPARELLAACGMDREPDS